MHGEKKEKPEILKAPVCVIVNPISGGIGKSIIVEELSLCLKEAQREFEIFYSDAPQHATLLTKEALLRGCLSFIIIGGDGSINEVSQSLIGTDAVLGIIPTGSGNGVARHLRIPTHRSKAIDVIRKNRIETIDTVRINNHFYIGVAGIGFDAEVGWKFSAFGHRGFLSYLILALQTLPTYEPNIYNLQIDGKKFSREAFLISFANSSQFGNGAVIAPMAQINDGFLDLVIMKKVPFYATAQVAYHLFNRSLYRSKYVEVVKCKTIIIEQPNLRAHIDGEPVFFEQGMRVEIVPASLNILVP